MTLNELEELAENAQEEYDLGVLIADGDFSYYDNFIAAANPQTLKRLIALCRLQHEALLVHIALTRPIDTSRKAVEAFDAFERNE